MSGTTPLRSYPYPTYGDPASFPSQQAAFATAVDTDLQALKVSIDEALDEPSARASRPAGTQAIATGVNVTVSYTTEDYDNDGIVNLGGSSTDFVIQTPGTYLLTGSVNMQPDASSTGSAALIMQSSVGTVPNPVGTSRRLDNDKDTSLSCTTLHRVPTAPETITMFVRHNHGVSLNASIAQLTVTRISS
jgi:hypothetical protein